MESSDQEFTQKNKDEFMKENRNWSPELAKVEQQRDVAMRENELLREKLAQQEENGESTIEKTKKERDYKKIALIAGAVAGGATGLIGGVPAATVGITAVLVGRLSSFVADKLAEHNIRKLSGQIAEEQDNEIKSKLENKLKNWGKVVNVVQHIKKFLTGAALGLAGSSIVSGLFFGGKGVFDTLGAARGEVGNISMPESQPQPQPQPTSGFIETPRTAQVAQEAVGGGTEELIQGDWFNTSNLGWDVSKFNWKGSNLYVPSDNVVSGGAPELQGKFLRALFEQGVNKQHLMGQEAGEMFNRGLVDAVYRGADMTTTVQNTADALKALAQ